MSLDTFIARAKADVDRLAPAAIAAATEIARAKGWNGHVIGSPLPAAERLYGMAIELGRPVARGEIPLEHAYAACIATSVAAERAAEIGAYAVRDIVSHQRWLIDTAAEAATIKRDLCAHQIRRIVAPMIANRKPRGELLSEAHGINGKAGFPLSENEVNDLVKTEVWYALPPAPRGRHGR